MKKDNPLRVLSVDFDYFQKVPNADVFEAYPDGIDLSSYLSTTVWASYYANPRTKEMLDKVKADRKGIEHLQKILGNSVHTQIGVMVAQSHKHIYDFIMDEYNGGDYDSVEVVNIDMHHDMYNQNPDVDCGNWLSHLVDDVENCDVTWVANKVSKKAYGMSKALEECVEFDLSVLDNKEFDLIFLCRSDNWLPPHLDKDFEDLYYYVLELFGGARVDQQITECREYKDLVSQIAKFYSVGGRKE